MPPVVNDAGEKVAPSPAEIRAARIAEGLSKPEAAALVYVTPRAWGYWESGDRKMGLAYWELFLLKAKGWMASDPEGDPE